MPATHLNPAAKIVARCGGVRKTSRIVGLNASAVSRWMMPREKRGTGGIVPVRHWPALMKHGVETGNLITIHDFLDM